ncbi:hypothetical protein [Halobacillus massiliensis]|uniref:hypothetical protein n=1 Tax=Halobacillus massiliensis TaxID=1926286 RepID=UPI0009E39675|nr:hypothetical protein [Halobacillus massiliensis]
MELKQILSGTATILTFIGFLPYILGTLRGSIKPHYFSWVIWSIVTIIVFFAQIQGGGGLGAWPIGISGIITVVVAILAYSRNTEIEITLYDWMFLLLTLSALPFWYFTSNPFWAVLLLTTVELLGFGPTLTKAYQRPWEENVTFFVLFMIRNALAITALERFTWTTVMFPAFGAASCLILISTILIRRASLTSS